MPLVVVVVGEEGSWPRGGGRWQHRDQRAGRNREGDVSPCVGCPKGSGRHRHKSTLWTGPKVAGHLGRCVRWGQRGAWLGQGEQGQARGGWGTESGRGSLKVQGPPRPGQAPRLHKRASVTVAIAVLSQALTAICHLTVTEWWRLGAGRGVTGHPPVQLGASGM